MCSKCVDNLISIFKAITDNKNSNVSWACQFEKQVTSISESLRQQYGSMSLELELSEELLHLIAMAKLAPEEYKLSYWLEFAVPDNVRSLDQKINVILEGFFNLAI